MSREGLASLLGRAALDRKFLEHLKKDPKGAAARHNVELTPEELKAVGGLDFEALTEFHESVQTQKAATFFDKKDV